MGGAGQTSLGGVAQATNADIAGMQAFSDSIKNGSFQLGILNKSDLSGLQGAIDGAINRAKALADAVQQAKDTLAAKSSSAQDAIDQATGNLDAIEERRHRKELADLRDIATKAGELNTKAFNDAVAKENKLHELNLQHIKEQQQARNGGGSSGSTSTSSQAGGSGAQGGGVFFGQPIALHLHIDNPTLVGNDLSKVGKDIAPAVLKELQRFQANNVKPILGR